MRIAIGGDVSVKAECEELFAKGNGKALFGNVCDAFASCDESIVNLETAITDKDTPIKKIGPNLRAPLNTAMALRDAGITALVLSNNHIFDYGKAGMKDTLAEIEKCGLRYTGFGENVLDARKNMILCDGKISVAVIAVCEHEYTYALKNRMGAREYDPYDTMEDIENAKKSADYVVVIYHGGAEGCRYPSPRLVKACRTMVKHGADVVLCQHSHCIGCYEKYQSSHILYGQGNFHFIHKKYEDKTDKGYAWNTGILVKLDIDSSLEIEFIPCVVDGNAIRLASDEEKDKILSEMYERLASLENGTWEEKWLEFALSRDRFKGIPEELCEEIAHYLDCESHTDVCREIYKTYNSTNEMDD